MISHADLKRIRLELGFTQKKMAAIIGYSYYNYRNIEQGQRNITKEFEETLFHFLNRKSKTKLEGSVDWLKIRFKTLDYKLVIENVLKLKPIDFFMEEKALYSYSHMVTYGAIRVLYSDSVKKAETGTLIDLTGGGCRELELLLIEQGRNWFSFLHDVFLFAENERKDRLLEDFLAFPRFDIALDELYKESGNLDLYDIKARIFDNKIVMRRIKTFTAIEGLKKVENRFVNQGLTLNFGSRQSSLMIRFYQKDYEQALLKDVSVEYIREVYNFKNRYEIELHDSKAYDVLKEWYVMESDLTKIGARILNNYFEVKDWEGHYDTAWDNLLGTQKGFKFVTRPRQIDYARTKHWVTKQVSSALKLMKIADMVYQTDELSEIISEAYLSNKHTKLAEEICERNGVDFDVLIGQI
ncbi:XRE family transcriptional regulator [Streptococcus chenjunshii]|uniref:XRE family transcriptional regulator n=1 Tax=Streptococcus chenjunshii TaxID=2173853 RepID=A0A372KKA4_9STRE|nr:replication initiation factor domain-containing protein [Streptococcus chenjunshii]AXQ77769.1 XRE family transcriptional regulator [Streptococcus chenjunshii]RFU50491.1 XRE family transcriptional regulator [Streptococcus chenjunshii]RFU52719.1 XRE family transcriptional regulator [Streptococcus chenjunshii]